METNVFQDQERLAALARVAAYNTEKLARLFGSSSRQFRRIFRATRGCPPREYLNDLRVAEAIKRLLAGAQPKRVAYEMGFNQPPSFYRWFKQSTGVAPLEYRKGKLESGASPESSPLTLALTHPMGEGEAAPA